MHRLPLHSCLLAVALLAGCATAGKQEPARPKDKKEAEYVYYYPTGSNIPVRVRKEDLASSNPESGEAQEAIRNLQRRGQKQPKGD
ncbi:MAG TPA: hypothetical protein VL200_01295 [Lacunisphaera sp.]|nr:hypothetical protein [Lacunisphaera sp.]